MPLKDDIRVSVVMAAFNAERFIAEAISSVLIQTYQNFLLYIVDDASSDNTVTVVEGFQSDKIKLLRHAANRGQSAARNTALDAVDGDFMAIIDADDSWRQDRLSTLIGSIQAAGNHQLFVSDNKMLCSDTVPMTPLCDLFEELHNIKIVPDEYKDYDLVEYFSVGSPVIHPLIPLDHIRKHRIRYTDGCRICEDLEFYCHLFRTGLKLRLIPEPLYYYRLSESSISATILLNADEITQVYRRILHSDGFSAKEQEALLRAIRKKELEERYLPLLFAIKDKKVDRILTLCLKDPAIVCMLFSQYQSILRYLKYRAVSLKASGHRQQVILMGQSTKSGV